jgi:hypothetical protein
MLYLKIQEDSRLIPYFLDNERVSYIDSVAYYHQIFMAMSDLVQDVFLTDSEIRYVYHFILKKLDGIQADAGTLVHIKTLDYMRIKLVKYQKWAETNEKYETLGNLNRLFELIYKKKRFNEQ